MLKSTFWLLLCGSIIKNISVHLIFCHKKNKNLSENKKFNKIEIIEPKNFDLNPEGTYSEIYKKIFY